MLWVRQLVASSYSGKPTEFRPFTENAEQGRYVGGYYFNPSLPSKGYV